MSIVERVLSRLGYFKANRVSEVLVPPWIGQQYGAHVPSGTAEYLNTYGVSSWVYACASLIAATAAQASYLLYVAVKRGGEVNYDQLVDHPVLELLDRPNPFMTGFELRELTHLNLELAGNHYWVLLRDGLNAIREIWPVSPALMRVVPDPQDYIKGYLMEVAGKRAAFEPHEVIHFKYPNPTNPEDPQSQFYGVGTVQAARLAITGDLYSSRWNVKFFANSARPDGALETEQKLEEPVAKRLLAWWNDAHRGQEKWHKTGMLTHGLRYKQITVNPKDMDFLQQRRFGRDEILAIFGVPASKLGIMEDANRANAEAGDYTFMKDVIMPKLVRMQERQNAFLLPQFDERLWGEYENAVPENREQVRKDREAGWNRWLTINDIRQEDGKPPVEGGDVIYLPLSLYPLGDAEPIGGGEGGKAGPGVVPPAGCRALRVLSGEEQEARRRRRTLQERLAKVSDEDRWKLFVKRIGPQEKRFQRILKVLFQGQENEVRERVRAGETDVDLITYDREAWQEKFRATGHPLVLEAVRAAGEEAMQEVADTAEGPRQDSPGAGGRAKGLFDVTNPLVAQYVADKVFKFAREVDATTVKELRAELIEALEQGESIPQIEDRVAVVFRAAKTYRTERIARTEIVGSSNQGALLGYKQSGLVPKKRWIVALDERTREWHAEMTRAEPVPIDEPFVVGGEEMNAPGDTNADAGNVVNCFPGDVEVVTPSGVTAATRRFYTGKVIEITTSFGHKLTGTPNHPVLTDRGWVPLGSIQKGNRIICRSTGKEMSFGNPDVQNAPTRISEFYDAFAQSGICQRVIGTHMDFHGDGRDGEVDIVCSDSHLLGRAQTALNEPIGQKVFPASNEMFGLFTLLGTGSNSFSNTLGTISPDSADDMSVGDKTPAFIKRGLRHADIHALTLIARNNASFKQATTNTGASDIEGSSKSFFRFPGQIASNDFGVGQKTVSLVSGDNTPLPEPSGNSFLFGVKHFGQGADGYAFAIETDEVIDIQVRSFSGDVYNLQTGGGWYIANNIITHNCRCTVAPVVE